MPAGHGRQRKGGVTLAPVTLAAAPGVAGVNSPNPAPPRPRVGDAEGLAPGEVLGVEVPKVELAVQNPAPQTQAVEALALALTEPYGQGAQDAAPAPLANVPHKHGSQYSWGSETA